MKRTVDHLAGDCTIIADISLLPVDPGEYFFSDAPSLAKTPDGALLCAAPQGHMRILSGQAKVRQGLLLFYRSDDNGNSWSELPAESRLHCSPRPTIAAR